MLRQIAINNAVLAIQYGISGLVTVLLIPHLVHELGLSGYGTLVIALAWANYGSIIVQYAFQLSGPKHLNQLRHGQSATEVVLTIISAKLTLLAIVLLFFGGGAWLTLHLDIGPNLPQAWLLVALPLAATMNTAWHLQAIGKFTIVSLISILSALFAMCVGFMGVQGGNASALLMASLALSIGPLTTGLGTLLASLKVITNSQLVNKLVWHSPWEELRIGWPLFVSQFVATLYSASGPLIIGFISGIEEAGAYGVIERIFSAVISVCLLTHTAAYPKLAQLYLSDRMLYLKLLRFVVSTYLTFVVLIIIAIVPYWNSLMHYFLGESTINRDLLLAFSLIWIALSIFGSVLTGYLTVSGQSNRVLPLTMLILIISLTLGIPSVITWGAWGWLASLCVSQLTVLAYSIRVYHSETSNLKLFKTK